MIIYSNLLPGSGSEYEETHPEQERKLLCSQEVKKLKIQLKFRIRLKVARIHKTAIMCF